MPHKLFVSIVIIAAVVLCQTNKSYAQRDVDQLPAITYKGWMPAILVDCPTAGTLKRGDFDVIMRSYPNGGILASTDIGLSNRFMIGISYGAEGIVAESRPRWNPRIEFNVKLNLVDEGLVFPAISVGFCSQGYGAHIDRFERYTFKSKGFYVVGSKNYPLLEWQIGIHGGVNYSTEREDDDNANPFIGFDTRFNDDVGLVLEYDFALNDNEGIENVEDEVGLGRGNGYLNLAIQWIYTDKLVLEILLKNLTDNRSGVSDIWRGFRVTLTEHF